MLSQQGKSRDATSVITEQAGYTQADGAEDEFDFIIRPYQALFAFPFQELWASRELLFFLTWRNIKARYRQAVIGAGWAILKPLMMMLVFVLVFGMLVRVPTGNVPYSVIVYTGLLPWTFVMTVISASTASLISNSVLLTKIYFPRLLIPLSVSLEAVVDLIVSLPVLFGLLLWFDIPITQRVLWLPLIFAILFLLAFGIGLVMATLNVRFHDIGMLLPIMLQMLMYGTPIIYPIELVPARWLNFYSLNPFVGLIQAIRWALVDTASPTPFMVASSVVWTLVILAGSLLFFRFAEDTFADVV